MASWTAHYDPGIPESLVPYPASTLLDFVRENAARVPEAPALFFKGTQLSNAELHRLSDRFAVSLLREGVARGDRVAFLLPNSPQFLIAELGAWKAGATVLPLNPMYTGGELVEPLRHAGVKLVVALTPFYDRIKDVQAQTPVCRLTSEFCSRSSRRKRPGIASLFEPETCGSRNC
jgi:long-chain acyl-CoA synthetase